MLRCHSCHCPCATSRGSPHITHSQVKTSHCGTAKSGVRCRQHHNSQGVYTRQLCMPLSHQCNTAYPWAGSSHVTNSVTRSSTHQLGCGSLPSLPCVAHTQIVLVQLHQLQQARGCQNTTQDAAVSLQLMLGGSLAGSQHALLRSASPLGLKKLQGRWWQGAGGAMTGTVCQAPGAMQQNTCNM